MNSIREEACSSPMISRRMIMMVLPRRLGTIKASLRFAHSLPATITIVAYAQFDNHSLNNVLIFCITSVCLHWLQRGNLFVLYMFLHIESKSNVCVPSLILYYTLQQFIHKGRGLRKPLSAEVKHKHTLKHTDTQTHWNLWLSMKECNVFCSYVYIYIYMPYLQERIKKGNKLVALPYIHTLPIQFFHERSNIYVISQKDGASFCFLCTY